MAALKVDAGAIEVDVGIDTLVFSGGGPLGMSFVGALRYMEHVGAMSRVRTVVGTSAGAIIALLCALGMSADEIMAWATAHSKDGSARLSQLDLDGLFALADRCGIDDGAGLVACLEECCAARVARDRIGGGAGDMTFLQLAKLTGRHLIVCTANLTRAEHQFFGLETSPHMSVALAVRMSCSVPFLYTPVVHNGYVHVDGSVFDHVPTDFAAAGSVAQAAGSAAQAAGSAHTALVLEVQMPTDVQPPMAEAGAGLTIVDYVRTLVLALVTRANRKPPAPTGSRADVTRHVVIPLLAHGPDGRALDSWHSLFDMETLSFSIDRAAIEALSEHGYVHTKLAFERRFTPHS